MAAASVSLVEGAASTRFNRMVAVSKHFPSFLPFILSPTPSLYYNWLYSLLLSFPLGLEGNYSSFFSFPFPFLFTLHNHISNTTTTTTAVTIGLTDHWLTLSRWAMTVAGLGLEMLGPFLSLIVFWVIRGIDKLSKIPRIAVVWSPRSGCVPYSTRTFKK